MITKYQNDEIDQLGNNQNNYIDTTTIPENKIDFEEHIRNLEKQINETKNKRTRKQNKTNIWKSKKGRIRKWKKIN
ncbi:hypothetical protein [Spiroplasma endosymbiont of Thecophora atra]|uniref:hypothetical protein n=1 Tax=Spiroplasma endosymbiont of Thecophora atra TaxID=3066294 RepID=UPI0030D45EDE